MARLVNAMREGIIDRMMTHTFTDRIRALCNEQMDCAEAAYNDIYSSAVRKRMYDLPNGWLPTRSSIQIKVDDDVISLEYSGAFAYSRYANNYSVFRLNDIEKIDMRHPQSDNGCLKVYEPDHKIAHKVVDFMRNRDALLEEYQKARKQLAVTLNRFYTVEKLIEEWPEIAPFIDEKDRPAPVTAIALPVQDLNAMFKLPVAGNAA